MKRVLAFLMLVAFAAGPALRVPCLLSCAAVDHVATSETCHSSQAGREPAVGGVDDCTGGASPIALAAKRAEVESTPFKALVVHGTVGLPLPAATIAAIVPELAAPSPPLSKLLIPLRI